MAFKFYNPNPLEKCLYDSAVRTIAVITNTSWEQAYIDLCEHGMHMGEMVNRRVIHSYFNSLGFMKEEAQGTVQGLSGYLGKVILEVGDYYIPVIDGDYIDAFNLGSETVDSIWRDSYAV